MAKTQSTVGGTQIPEVVSKFARSVNLEQVFVRRAKAELVKGPAIAVEQLGIDVRAGAKKAATGSGLEVAVGVTVKFLGATVDETLAVVDVDYVLYYSIPEASVLAAASDATIQAFAAYNGTVNAWSYAREYCQSMAWRMSLPPTTLPSFRHEMFPGLLQHVTRLLQNEGTPRVPSGDAGPSGS